MAQTVVGMFENESDAQKAVARLETIGIDESHVDMARGIGTMQDTKDESGNAVSRFFTNLFGDDDDNAERYSRMGNSGQYCVVTVHTQTNEQAVEASQILDECGAVDVDEQAAALGAGTIGTDRSTSDGITISKVQETLNVGKREVESGGVRVRSRIVEKPVEETLRLREERVNVERKAVDRPLSEGDMNAFEEQDISMTERSEVPVVSKEARVVEEIKISKDVNERTETIRDTVRNTEIDIDELDSTNKQRNKLR